MKRIAELDAIRGLAALAIMVNHLPFSNRLIHLGAYGVDLFFVLSGYLITTIILKNAGSTGFMTSFYVRRSLRIWPIYYLALIAVVAINPLFDPPFSLAGWPFYATYTQGIQNYWFGTVPAFSPLLDHTWTLALEEQYYLIWPVLVLLLGPRSVATLALSLTALALVARSVGFSNRILIGRCDGFALGGLLAAILPNLESARSQERIKRYFLGFSLIGLVALGYPAWVDPVVRSLSSIDASRDAIASSLRLLAVTVVFFCLVGVILLAAGRPELAWLRNHRLVYLGQISYGIYLYHYPIYFIIDTLTGKGGALWVIALKVTASIVVASLSWRWVESPILRLKSRFEYHRARRDSPVTAETVTVEGPALP
jgi:peptidoglycan/LPS O-acetylase OafA/YrhL